MKVSSVGCEIIMAISMMNTPKLRKVLSIETTQGMTDKYTNDNK